MASSEETKGISEDPEDPEVAVFKKNPFLRANRAIATNPTKEALTRTVGQLNLASRETLQQVSPKVKELTVKDLNDLAIEFSGVKSGNPKVQGLNAEDIRDLEALFFEFKVTQIGKLPGQELGLPDLELSISCCCCTPCCSCCAATDVDPFERA